LETLSLALTEKRRLRKFETVCSGEYSDQRNSKTVEQRQLHHNEFHNRLLSGALRGPKRSGSLPPFEAHNHNKKLRYMKQNKAPKRDVILNFI
jgi:hypothetical protein